MAIKVICDMCGITINATTDQDNGSLNFDGYTVEFKDAGSPWAKVGYGLHEDTYHLCDGCAERLAKKATGWYKDGV